MTMTTDDYEDASSAVGDFLRHSQTMCVTAAQLSVVTDIYDFLNGDEQRWEQRYGRGWSGDLRKACKRLCENVIRDEGWPSKIERKWRALCRNWSPPSRMNK
ncbi:hypothetical protein NLX71_14225 [Paenibacillus sp. MZ04-78.2]|uniref:hypothetical protein n=1 Tax=Paenibacillus sp. MZ04-78.2 TaxID=2962034 RepID=UPI0020B685BE|nr:hypothetical protein [Paenibacillus sp. MZ04-78.2]MCP3774453.1 hypothetical protein [Paenibacillus sp. MZ04-78.2]